MYRTQIGTIICFVLIAVCITSMVFLVSDIARYINVIETMITFIFYSMRLILIFIAILFISLLFLVRYYK
jgi:Na+/H+ antiporter NhaD/arsenite permease-like protein